MNNPWHGYFITIRPTVLALALKDGHKGRHIYVCFSGYVQCNMDNDKK